MFSTYGYEPTENEGFMSDVGSFVFDPLFMVGGVVGSGTVKSDDPSLNVRGLGTCVQPYRIVLSSNLAIPIKSKLAKTIHEQPVWIFHSKEVSEARKNKWLQLPKWK